MPALPALVAPLASALAAALAHRSATQRGCGAAARPAGCPFDVPGIAGAACPFVRGSTERKPGLHRLSAGGRWIRTNGTADDARLLADLYAHNASRQMPQKGVR